MNPTSPASAGASRPVAGPSPSAAPVLPTRSRRFDVVAAAAVFGVPFTWCLHGALRGELFLGRYAFFGTDTPVADLLACGTSEELLTPRRLALERFRRATGRLIATWNLHPAAGRSQRRRRKGSVKGGCTVCWPREGH